MSIFPEARNHWTQLSIEYANERCYLDDLYRVYPVVHDSIRDVDEVVMKRVERYFNEQDSEKLIRELLKLELFPLKDSYVPYLRRDPGAISRNPNTIRRICGSLYDMGFTEVYKRCTEPKEANRQIGPMFRNYLNSGAIGIRPVDERVFLSNKENAILDGSDSSLMEFAYRHLGYKRNKGLDFIGRFNGKYVIGEAKFISDFGGHQNDQFLDAVATLNENVNPGVLKIGIIDGVPYIPNKGKLYGQLINSEEPILSALLLRDYLYSV